MKRNGLILLFLSIHFCGFSQTDSISIGNKIADSEFSKPDMISKGRRLLLDEFEAGNMIEVKKIMDYFDSEIRDANHVPLWPTERLLLYYWTEDYDKILYFCLNHLGQPSAPSAHMVVPADEILYLKLVDRSDEQFDMLIDHSKKYVFSRDEEDFLFLLLDRLLIDGDKQTYKEVNKKAESFVSQYPESPLSTVVEKQIAYKLVPANSVFGFYFGGGYASSSGKMTEYFNPHGTVSMSIDYYYNKFAFFGVINASYGNLQQDIPLGEDWIWEAGNQVQLSSLSLNIGYSVINNSRFRITPLAGVSFGNLLTPTEEDSPDPELSLKISPAVLMGINFAYKFYNSDLYDNLEGHPQTSVGANLRIAYVPSILSRNNYQYTGNTLYVTLGISGDFFSSKRSSKLNMDKKD